MPNYKKIETWGAAFGVVLGTLLHFTYEWSGQLGAVGLFSATNESVWEHTKLIVFPILIFFFLELRFITDRRRLLLAKVVEAAFGILFMISFFYTYTSVLGISSLFPVDIASFMVSVILGKFLSYGIITGQILAKIAMPWFTSAIILVVMVAGFFTFTFRPPHIPLFTDHSASSGTVASAQREMIEIKYPEFKDFENQESFAGKSVKELKEGNDYYVAFMVLGSGVPIVQATCFRVDWMRRVYKIGEFPIGLDSYAGYREVDPKTCNGVQ